MGKKNWLPIYVNKEYQTKGILKELTKVAHFCNK